MNFHINSVQKCASMCLLSVYGYQRANNMRAFIEVALCTYLFAVSISISSGCPNVAEVDKSAYNTGDLTGNQHPITLATIKKKLKESGIFDEKNLTLNAVEKKELDKLFDAVEIMTTSRNRQPSNVQNMFSSLRLVERAVKKSLKEGRISESLASKFNWNKLNGIPIQSRHRREKPLYYIDKKTNMRIFNTK